MRIFNTKTLHMYSAVLRNCKFIGNVRFLQLTSISNIRKSLGETSNLLIGTEIDEASEENKAGFIDYFGIESDEGSIVVDDNSGFKLQPTKFNLKDRDVKFNTEKFHATSFGILRKDSENTPIRHGQYEESESEDLDPSAEVNQGFFNENQAVSNFSLSRTNQRSNNQILQTDANLLDTNSDVVSSKKRSVVSLNRNLIHTEKSDDKFNQKRESNSEINHEENSFIDDIYFSDSYTKDSAIKLNTSDNVNKNTNENTDFKNSDVNTGSYIDSLYFTNENPGDQIISNNLHNVDKTNFSESKNSDNLIEKFYFADKLEGVAEQEVHDETTSFKNINLHTETTNEVNEFISKFDQTNFLGKTISEVNRTTAQDQQDVNTEYKSSKNPKKQNLHLVSNRSENVSKSHLNTERFQKHSNFEVKDLKKIEAPASHQYLLQNNIGKNKFIFSETFKNTTNQGIVDNTKQHSNPTLTSKVSKEKHQVSETEHFETAQDFVKNLRTKSTDYSSLKDKTIAKRETLDSKGFRILENQVLKLSYFTRDEILDMLTKCVLYSDENLVVLNKPYNIVMHDSKTTKDHCLSTFLDDLAKELDKDSPSPKLQTIHRLDKETTGCLLLARNEATAQYLKSLFSQRRISKTYWIVTVNVPDPLEGTIDIPIAEGKIDNKARMVLSPKIPDGVKYSSHAKSGKRAISHYKVIAIAGNAALVEVKPETGIKHQIRVHFGFGLACPILGDHKYSHLKKLAPQKLPADMLQRLHVRQSKVRHIPMHMFARDIVIPEYANGRNLFVSAPMPEHMSRNLRTLKFRKKDKL